MNTILLRSLVSNMFKWRTGVAALLGAAFFALLVSGCATQPAAVKEEKVPPQTDWPLPPDPPRIRYMGELSTLELPDDETSLKDILLGKEQSQKISSLAKPYAVHSDSKGRVFIAQTDARNDANGRSGTKKHGLKELENRAFLNRITRVDSSLTKAEFFDLEPLPPKQPKRQTKSYLYECVTYSINQAKWKAAREWCADRKIEFKIITEHELGIK